MSELYDCPLCQRNVYLNTDGRIRGHRVEPNRTSMLCLAGGQMPDAFLGKYIVTVKMPKGHAGPHNPHDKKTGSCVISEFCTDVTGEHHSTVVSARNAKDAAAEIAEAVTPHITRVERIG